MKKLILKVVAGATLIAGVGVTSSCAKSNSLKNKTVDFIRLIDNIQVGTYYQEFTKELYTRKQFLNLCKVTESNKDGKYNLTLALNKKYDYFPELYVCEATKDSIVITRTIAYCAKTQYQITLLDNNEFLMEERVYKTIQKNTGETTKDNIYKEYYENVYELEEDSYVYNYYGSVNFKKGNASIIGQENEKDVARYDFEITKDKINKMVLSYDIKNTGNITAVRTFEISLDGKTVSNENFDGFGSLEEREFYSNGIVKESIKYLGKERNGNFLKDQYIQNKYNQKGQLVEMISQNQDSDNRFRCKATYSNNTAYINYYEDLNDDAEILMSMEIAYDEFGRICSEDYSYKDYDELYVTTYDSEWNESVFHKIHY